MFDSLNLKLFFPDIFRWFQPSLPNLKGFNIRYSMCPRSRIAIIPVVKQTHMVNSIIVKKITTFVLAKSQVPRK
jgi:hypothetical protein